MPPTDFLGHWCNVRHRLHFEPCGCDCEACAEYTYLKKKDEED